jgi:hypothetical protein
MAANFDRVYRSPADDYSLWKEEAREFNASLWGITFLSTSKHMGQQEELWSNAFCG